MQYTEDDPRIKRLRREVREVKLCCLILLTITALMFVMVWPLMISALQAGLLMLTGALANCFMLGRLFTEYGRTLDRYHRTLDELG